MPSTITTSPKRRYATGSPFFDVTYDGTPIQDVNHPALKGNTGVRTGLAWRDAQAARAFGLDYEEFAALERDRRITILAQHEIAWRIEALQAWEQEQARKVRARSRPKPKSAPRLRRSRHG